jgi:hypothetical protein
MKNLARVATRAVTMMKIIIRSNFGLIQPAISTLTDSGTMSAKMKTEADPAIRPRRLVRGKSFTGLKNIAIPTTIKNIHVKWSA